MRQIPGRRLEIDEEAPGRLSLPWRPPAVPRCSYEPASDRALVSLHLTALKGEPAAEDGAVLVRASHDTLARMAAMSRSHVTVTMGRFRERVHVAALREHLAGLPDRRRDGP